MHHQSMKYVCQQKTFKNSTAKEKKIKTNNKISFLKSFFVKEMSHLKRANHNKYVLASV
jgi:hypothetical protein